MTEIQKKTIREMRFRGYGYKKIASDLKLKRDTVRDYCRCHKITGNRDSFLPAIKLQMAEGKVCTNCGFPIEQPMRGKRIFCSSRCRSRYGKYRGEK